MVKISPIPGGNRIIVKRAAVRTRLGGCRGCSEAQRAPPSDLCCYSKQELRAGQVSVTVTTLG